MSLCNFFFFCYILYWNFPKKSGLKSYFYSAKKTSTLALARWLSGLECCPRTPKGYGFDPRSGHIPRLWVWLPLRVQTGDNWSIFLSYINISLSLPPLFPLSLKLINISSGEKKKKISELSKVVGKRLYTITTSNISISVFLIYYITNH